MHTTGFRIFLITLAAAELASAQATELVLHNFATPPKGATPEAGVIGDAAGILYGTTVNGGVSGLGTVYEVHLSGRVNVLHSFSGGTDGANPYAGVIRDAAGNLYGTTLNGGVSNLGTVYRIDASGQGTVLHSFAGGIDGANPNAGVVRDAAGNLYGTTLNGGASGYGTVYKINPSGQGMVLHSFTGGSDGANPYAGVIRDAAGNLYGTTLNGGASGYGSVYEIDSSGQEAVLYSFTDGTDGADPYAGVIRDAEGNLYGTTFAGGAAGFGGTVYKIDASGQEKSLHSFSGGTDGANPYAGVIRDAAGNLYGTTSFGGSGYGTVYQIDPLGQETVLYSFTNADGAHPSAGVVRDGKGNLFGTTEEGGASDYGTVYKVNPLGQEIVLHSFTDADGYFPLAGVIRDASGNLYGTTLNGGASGYGSVYEIDSSGQEAVLYSFMGGTDGANPYGGVIRDVAGNLYGTTENGGASGDGTVYKINLPARRRCCTASRSPVALAPMRG